MWPSVAFHLHPFASLLVAYATCSGTLLYLDSSYWAVAGIAAVVLDGSEIAVKNRPISHAETASK